MARSGRTNYKQVKTGTVDLGNEGAQIHIAEIKMIDDALRGSFVNNVQFSVQQNISYGFEDGDSRTQVQGYTFYLSYESDSWSDDSVIAAYAVAVAGNGNLVAKRVIKTNETGSTVAEQIGPVHVWMEGTDMTIDPFNISARVTLTAWGRMILLVEDF